jgi:ATP-binding protein involved in chromosome partitioning
MSSSNSIEAAALAALSRVVDREFSKDVVSLGYVKDLVASPEKVALTLELPCVGHPSAEDLRRDVVAAVQKAAPGVPCDVGFATRVRAFGGAATNALPGVKNIIAVGSGKGGVGKSTVAANLAAGLAALGAKTGCLDADIYGPSIPTMFGVAPDVKPTVSEVGGRKLMEPVAALGVKLVSMGFLVDADRPVIWRGPMLHGALRQFFTEVAWGELDYLIVDLPPGTGDVSLTLAQTAALTGAVVVSTPQNVALLDARKAAAMFAQTNIPILGIVENMSGSVFGSGGAKAWAGSKNLNFLGELPLVAAVRESGDAGVPAALSKDPTVSSPYLDMARRVAVAAAKRCLEAPATRPISLDAGSMSV